MSSRPARVAGRRGRVAWLALLLVRVAERHTGQTWRRINLELGRLNLVTLAGPAGRVQHTTALTPKQRELFTATGITPPPRVTSLQTTSRGVGARRTTARPLSSQLTAQILAIGCPPAAELGTVTRTRQRDPARGDPGRARGGLGSVVAIQAAGGKAEGGAAW